MRKFILLQPFVYLNALLYLNLFFIVAGCALKSSDGEQPSPSPAVPSPSPSPSPWTPTPGTITDGSWPDPAVAPDASPPGSYGGFGLAPKGDFCPFLNSNYSK